MIKTKVRVPKYGFSMDDLFDTSKYTTRLITINPSKIEAIEEATNKFGFVEGSYVHMLSGGVFHIENNLKSDEFSGELRSRPELLES